MGVGLDQRGRVDGANSNSADDVGKTKVPEYCQLVADVGWHGLRSWACICGTVIVIRTASKITNHESFIPTVLFTFPNAETTQGNTLLYNRI